MGERGWTRQPEAQRVEIILETFAALRPFVDGQPRRFVDHQHQAVAIDEPSHYLFRGHGHLPTLDETAITIVISNEPGRHERPSGRKEKLVAAAPRRPQAHLSVDRRSRRR